MRRYLPLVLCSVLLVGGAQAQITVIKAGRLVDVERGNVVEQQSIIVKGTKVEAVGRDLPIPPDATVIDLSSMTVLPGLIDCHTHLVGRQSDLDPLAVLQHTAAEEAFSSIPNARKTLEAGFTTVRDLGTYRALVDLALRDAIARGEVIGPRMFAAGAYVTITGGAGAMTGVAPDITLPWDLRFGQADSPDQVRQRVRELVSQGADVIKVLASGAVLTHRSNPGASEFTSEELRAAVEEAHKFGLRVAAHAHGAQAIKNAVRAGVDSIEHGTMLDDEGIALMKEHGTYLVADIYDEEYIQGEGRRNGMPTDFLEHDANLGQLQRDNFRKAVKAGVKVAFGTDAGVYPHGDNAKQFAFMVRYGLTPMQAIQSATLWAADLLGKKDALGSVRSGKYADLIAVEGDPIGNVSVLEHVSFVMKDGQVFKNIGVVNAK